MAPIVSIIIPVYNRPVLVAEAIESVLAQTNPNWELIVVDDGSTDNTWEVLESYAAKDERIRVFKRDREPKGANRCRNMGAELATSDYLAFLDSDDLIGETFVETREKYIKEYPELDFIVFSEAVFEKSPKKGYSFKNILFKEKDDLIRFLERDTPWLTSGPIWKKKSFFKINGFLEGLKIGQDWDIHLRALLFKLEYKKIDFTKKPDVFKRISPEVPTIGSTNSVLTLLDNKVLIFRNLMKEGAEKRIINERPLIRRKVIDHFLQVCKRMFIAGNKKGAYSFLVEIREVKEISFFEFLFFKIYLSARIQHNPISKRALDSILLRVFNRVI